MFFSFFFFVVVNFIVADEFATLFEKYKQSNMNITKKETKKNDKKQMKLLTNFNFNSQQESTKHNITTSTLEQLLLFLFCYYLTIYITYRQNPTFNFSTDTKAAFATDVSDNSPINVVGITNNGLYFFVCSKYMFLNIL